MPDYLRNGGSWVGDLLIAGVALLLAFAAFSLARTLGWWHPVHGASYAFVAVATAAAWPLSRVFPRTTLALAAVIVSVPLWHFNVVEIRLFPLMVAAFRAAAAGSRRAFVIPVTIMAGLAGIFHPSVRVAVEAFRYDGRVFLMPPADPSTDVLVAALLVVVLVLGYSIRAQRTVETDLRARNAELVTLRDADRARVETEMRTALARDIHDVVAHHVSAMVIRAQAAERVGPDDSRQLREAIRGIASDGSEALAGMRQAVRMLRATDGRDHERPEDDVPAITDVDGELRRMVERAQASGRQVDVSGELVGGSEFVHTALVRIVQESLTNVMLHSDATRVAIRFASTGTTLSATIADNGRPAVQIAGAAGGNGIRGMHERATALGGTLSAGPAPDGGWTVQAVLPGTGHRTESR
ncbi:hypothetical protein AGMMS50218_04360 [Actinomycetota bacterium]|nr:hypothetical protein AGMMS50218_04360 [Actinomycetota bacterium]